MKIRKITIGLKGQVNMGNDEWYQPLVTMEAELDESEDVDKAIQLLRVIVQKQVQNDILQFRQSRKIVTAVAPNSRTMQVRQAMSGKQRDKGATVETVSSMPMKDSAKVAFLKKLLVLVKRLQDAFRKK